VAACDAKLLSGDKTSPGSLGLIKECRALGKLSVHVEPGVTRPSQVASFLGENRHVRVLMVAGNRESKAAGIGARVEAFLGVVLRQLGHAGEESITDE
jgi:hypothetical protein